MVKFNTVYDRKHVQTDFKLPTRTEQCYKNECDIDFVISNFVRTGIDPNATKKMSYVDCTQVKDFQEANNLIAETKSMFYSLPAIVRDEFGTIDNYLEFISNPANLKESYEKGLIDPSTVDINDVYPTSDTQSVSDTQNTSSPSSEPPLVDIPQPVSD